jgi:hypothetical protein
MSGRTKKHLTKNEASAVVSLLLKSTGVFIPKDKKDLTVERVIEVVEEIIEEVELEAWDNKRKSEQLDPIKGPAMALKGARLREGLTQAEVVAKIEGLNQPNLSSMEKGERPIPEHMVKKFAKLYKIKPNLLQRLP